jgi:beta-galactosidase
MKKTGRFLREHAELLDAYKPDRAHVGILFSPQSYYLHWAQEGTAITAQQALQGYARALVRCNINYTIVEEEHLEALQELKVLFLPRTLVVDDTAAEALSAFVRNGGTLVAESECGAFSSAGIYRYPEDRFLAALTGTHEVGRRLPYRYTLDINLAESHFAVPCTQWTTPFKRGTGTILDDQDSTNGDTALEISVGKGRVFLFASYLGEGYYRGSALDDRRFSPYHLNFEFLLKEIVRQAGVIPGVELLEPTRPQPFHPHDLTESELGQFLKVASPPLVRAGWCGSRRVVFVFQDYASNVIKLRFPVGFGQGKATELMSGERVALEPTPKGWVCTVERRLENTALIAEG